MKRSTILTLILFVGLISSTCKKKYPKDIPKWLKEKIEGLEKDSKGKGCKYDECRVISEHTDGSSTYYIFADRGGPYFYYIYNYPGTLLCTYEGGIINSCNLKYSQLEKTRNIWIEN